MLLNKAEWLGKGQRAMGRVAPRVLEPVIVAEPVIAPEPAKAAAKEKKIEDELPEPDPIAATMPTVDAPAVAAPTQEIFSLAADPEPVAPTEPAAAPAPPVIDVPVEMRGEDIFLQQGNRRYRVRGLAKNMSYELLKVNVLVSGATQRGEQAFHVDTLDLYSARQRGVFMKQAAEELGIKEDVIDIDEELLNRCLVLTVNEERAQTQAIHRIQRESQTIEGLLRRKDRDELLRLHRNAQRLLKPVSVVNPYAPGLTFLDSPTRTRRDHTKYLTLIRTIALLHQHQRPRQTVEHNGKTIEYIEVALDDIAVANRLTAEVLGRSLDELPPQTRRLLLAVDEMVTAECKRQRIERVDYRFSRRDVREATGWGDTQLRLHLGRLEELEYLLAHRGGRGQSFVYELAFAIEGDGGKPVMAGLIDVEKLGGYPRLHPNAATGPRSNASRSHARTQRKRSPEGSRSRGGKTLPDARRRSRRRPRIATSNVLLLAAVFSG